MVSLFALIVLPYIGIWVFTSLLFGSTNLDTNWGWLQLRAMQVSGNANATNFFKQHGCDTSDSQRKYKSRAATLYKSKVADLAAQAHRLNGTKAVIDTHTEQLSPVPNEQTDFFEQEFTGSNVPEQRTNEFALSKDSALNSDVSLSHELGGAKTADAPVQKKPIKKIALGAKKGLGAQKVKTNFNDVEKKADEFDKERENFAKLSVQEETTTKSEANENPAVLSSKFMVKDPQSLNKAKEKLKEASKDPAKAEVVERLGMGGGLGRGRVSHSISSGIKTINQEGVSKLSKKSSDSFQADEWELLGNDNRSKDITDLYGGSNSKVVENEEFFDAWDRNAPTVDKNFTAPKSSAPVISAPASDDAVKKFGNAKSISSDQYFGNGQEMDYDTRTTLARFDGQKAIGSADLWGTGNQQASSSYSDHIPEMADIKDSIRAGAGKVAEKFSSLSSYLSRSSTSTT
ncbi:Arf-GAP domain-containing protein [Aphelenchoides bicaudatus]|nr:Arf-GAP domain-containing protein [Aphelenchoides bicaudatus]